MDHLVGDAFSQEEVPKFRRADVVEASFDVLEEGGDVQAGSLEGPYFVGKCSDGNGGTESREGATLVWMKKTDRLSQSPESDSDDPLECLGNGF